MSSVDPDWAHFERIPWCKKILEDPDFVFRPTGSRTYKEATTEDALFGRIFNSDDTINSCVSMYRRPAPDASRVEEVRTLLSLGSGLNGQAKTCHGGVLATIMDEVMSVLLSTNKDHQKGPVRMATVTASLNVTYLKPVATPQVVLVTAKLGDVKGRKWFIHAAVTNSEGVQLAKADALWIVLNRAKEKL